MKRFSMPRTRDRRIRGFLRFGMGQSIGLFRGSKTRSANSPDFSSQPSFLRGPEAQQRPSARQDVSARVLGSPQKEIGKLSHFRFKACEIFRWVRGAAAEGAMKLAGPVCRHGPGGVTGVEFRFGTPDANLGIAR